MRAANTGWVPLTSLPCLPTFCSAQESFLSLSDFSLSPGLFENERKLSSGAVLGLSPQGPSCLSKKALSQSLPYLHAFQPLPPSGAHTLYWEVLLATPPSFLCSLN